MPDMLIGAGTVLTVAQAEQAVSAGAEFMVSPALTPAVAGYCVNQKIPFIPGCVTPTEMLAAREMGLDTVKFFPAEQAGGLAYLKAVSGPFPNLCFVPTGGIDACNLSRYAALPSVLACGGSWMVNQKLLNDENYTEITRLCRQAVETVRAAREGFR
jgi:2-dehydro-3-deoxyphosphogluconate aldolase/(4S)-4-hydroxy-2-oxoglutarate aldolase